MSELFVNFSYISFREPLIAILRKEKKVKKFKISHLKEIKYTDFKIIFWAALKR